MIMKLIEIKKNPYGFYNALKKHKDSEIPPYFNKNKKIVKFITKNCGTMLDAYQKTGRVLYRGMDTDHKVVYTNIRPDRRPIEMNPEIHNFSIEWFEDLGLKAHRGNSIFCSAKEETAQEWGRGECHIIFVRDGWNGTIFEGRRNSYVFHDIERYGNRLLGAQLKKSSELELKELSEKILLNLKTLGPKNFSTSEELQIILKKGYKDILITGKDYIGIDYDYFVDNLMDDLNINLGESHS